jgi:hypothetical protein
LNLWAFIERDEARFQNRRDEVMHVVLRRVVHPISSWGSEDGNDLLIDVIEEEGQTVCGAAFAERSAIGEARSASLLVDPAELSENALRVRRRVIRVRRQAMGFCRGIE